MVARREVAVEQDLDELGDELAEVGVQAVDVLGALALGQLGLCPRELEVRASRTASSCVTATHRDFAARAQNACGTRCTRPSRMAKTSKPTASSPEARAVRRATPRRPAAAAAASRPSPASRAGSPNRAFLFSLTSTNLIVRPRRTIRSSSLPPAQTFSPRICPAAQPVPAHRFPLGREAGASSRQRLEASAAKPTTPGRMNPGRLRRPVASLLRLVAERLEAEPMRPTARSRGRPRSGRGVM